MAQGLEPPGHTALEQSGEQLPPQDQVHIGGCVGEGTVVGGAPSVGLNVGVGCAPPQL